MSVLNNTITLSNREYFIAPGVETLTALLMESLIDFDLTTEFITKEKIVSWIAKQSFLDFGSNRGRFLGVSLENMGNARVDSIFCHEALVHYPQNFKSGLRTWSEIAPASKRLAVGILLGNSRTKLPDEMLHMNIADYKSFLLNLFEILTDNGIAVIDCRTIDEVKLHSSLIESDFCFVRKNNCFILSKKELYTLCSEIVSEILPALPIWLSHRITVAF